MAGHHPNANNALINLERSYKPAISTWNLSAAIYLQAYLLLIYFLFIIYLLPIWLNLSSYSHNGTNHHQTRRPTRPMQPPNI
jgi:hypothetical protein